MGDTSVCSLFGHGPKGDNLLVKPRLFMLQSSYSKRQRWRSSGLSTLKFIWKDNSVWQPSNLMQIKKKANECSSPHAFFTQASSFQNTECSTDEIFML